MMTFEEFAAKIAVYGFEVYEKEGLTDHHWYVTFENEKVISYDPESGEVFDFEVDLGLNTAFSREQVVRYLANDLRVVNRKPITEEPTLHDQYTMCALQGMLSNKHLLLTAKGSTRPPDYTHEPDVREIVRSAMRFGTIALEERRVTLQHKAEEVSA